MVHLSSLHNRERKHTENNRISGIFSELKIVKKKENEKVLRGSKNSNILVTYVHCMYLSRNRKDQNQPAFEPKNYSESLGFIFIIPDRQQNLRKFWDFREMHKFAISKIAPQIVCHNPYRFKTRVPQQHTCIYRLRTRITYLQNLPKEKKKKYMK